MSESNTSNVKIVLATAIGGALAAIVNVLIFTFAHSFGLIPDSVIIPGANAPLTIPPVAIASLIPSIIAGIGFAIMKKYFKKAFIIFFALSIVLLLLSFLSPMTIPNAPREMIISLNTMHVVVVAFILLSIRKAIGI